MKTRNIFIAVAIFICCSAQADQTNYVRRVVNNTHTGNMVTTTYYDGHCRPIQVVKTNGAGEGSDLITQATFDYADRPLRQYLPYSVVSNNGNYRSNGVAEQGGFYASLFVGETHPYVESIYEKSSRNITSENYNPGKVFRDNNKKSTYKISSLAAAFGYVFTVNPQGDIVANTYRYTIRHEFTDPDGKYTVRHIDDGGLLQREVCGVLTTYYVYDERNLLRWVVSPEAKLTLSAGVTYSKSSDVLCNYAYMYNYDHRGRLVEKRLPGCESVFYVYDNCDRVMAMQDGVMRLAGRWEMYVYDALLGERLCEIWKVPYGGTLVDMRSGYASIFASSSSKQRTTSYVYDSYPSSAIAVKLESDVIVSGEGLSGVTSSVMGLKCFERIESAESGGDYVERTFRYNNRGHLIQIAERNHLGGVSYYSMAYDLVGNLKKSVEEHSGVSATPDRLETNRTHDQWGRLVYGEVSLNGVQAAVQRSYNSRGQLATEGGITYAYNVQGWLTEKSSGLLSLKLRYYNPLATPKRWGGDITEFEWKHLGVSVVTPEWVSGFSYDSFGRLASSSTHENLMSTNKYTEQGITYDYNGNIKSLKRYGGMGNLEDDFTYNYSGNKLLNINTGTSFVYDANGNMTKDGRRNLEFEYNSLNLLSKVKVGSTINAVYAWGVDGSKRSVTDGSGLNGFEYLGSMVYKRQNGILSLESAPFDGGRILKTLSGYDVFRYTTDHLGSVRVISNQIGQVVFRGDYYPFGESYSTIGMSSAFTRDKFNGKELQTTGSVGLLDYGARMYDTRLGRWLTLDPKSESYWSLSPYAYVANNPLRYIDPEGMKIAESSKVGWERNKAAIEKRIDKIQQRMDKLVNDGASGSRVAGFGERISGINSTLGTMRQLESSSQVYALGGLDRNGLGGVTYDNRSGVITIGYSGTANFVHEVTHAGQFETGDIAFSLVKGTYAQDIYDEVSAYKAQYAYDPASVSGLESSSIISTSVNITAQWVRGIVNNGNIVYKTGVGSTMGIFPVNINSTKAEVLRAYPNANLPLGIPINHPFKKFEPMHYKK